MKLLSKPAIKKLSTDELMTYMMELTKELLQATMTGNDKEGNKIAKNLNVCEAQIADNLN